MAPLAVSVAPLGLALVSYQQSPSWKTRLRGCRQRSDGLRLCTRIVKPICFAGDSVSALWSQIHHVVQPWIENTPGLDVQVTLSEYMTVYALFPLLVGQIIPCS
jgi:hypothetical protein